MLTVNTSDMPFKSGNMTRFVVQLPLGRAYVEATFEYIDERSLEQTIIEVKEQIGAIPLTSIISIIG